MSYGARLARLEDAVTVVPAADRGSYCCDCGGLAITDYLLARSTRRGGNRMTPEDAAAVYEGLKAGAEWCRRCGAETLAGMFRGMLARRDARRLTA
jgi:hypothetical protein